MTATSKVIDNNNESQNEACNLRLHYVWGNTVVYACEKLAEKFWNLAGVYEHEVPHAREHPRTENQYLQALPMKELVISRGSRWREEQSGFRACSWWAIKSSRWLSVSRSFDTDVHYAFSASESLNKKENEIGTLITQV